MTRMTKITRVTRITGVSRMTKITRMTRATIFRAYFSVQETLVLSFNHVILSKGGFLVHKNDILL